MSTYGLIDCSPLMPSASLCNVNEKGSKLKDLGQRIKRRREALTITQQELADALRVSPQYVSAIEKNKKVPSLALVSELAKQLGVSIDYLASGEEDYSMLFLLK